MIIFGFDKVNIAVKGSGICWYKCAFKFAHFLDLLTSFWHILQNSKIVAKEEVPLLHFWCQKQERKIFTLCRMGMNTGSNLYHITISTAIIFKVIF